MFTNKPAALKVKCVTPSEERLQQVPTPEGPQEGPRPTKVSLNEASFHNKRKQKDSSPKRFKQLHSALWRLLLGLFVWEPKNIVIKINNTGSNFTD